MELNRFKQLLESTMGNVKPLISEQETTVVDLTDLNSQVPDNLVDTTDTPNGTYTSTGGNGEPSVVNTFTLCFNNTCFKVSGSNVKFNWSPGIDKTVQGQIQGERNSFFFEPYVDGGKTYNLQYYLGDKLATEVVNNSEDKIIGFTNESINFFCYVPKTGGGYVCDKFSYVFPK
jgi:hypothetical protein